ncbi:conserved hypothetical protein [Thermotomaculum hydrothermale]|uniref:GerMN domain-containing protein n=1 Tax=Thermotomaculum hydrothermale TaxID=981385 RepID=A0A7R6SXP7_9BACT|nr:GerMN domain-containing protein [Thermotomaculum hydrothermale]BBB31780.1 conserved hypothetical protein [Thermotomaculum hydrothermale]
MKNKAFFIIITAVLFLLFACNGKKTQNEIVAKSVQTENENQEQKDEIKPDESEKLKFRIINLYFINPYTNELKTEKRQVFDLKEKTSMIKQVLRSLKLGPVSNLKPSVPENIEFKDVFIYGDRVYIDLHKNSENAFIGGVKGEKLFLEAVVKTVLDISPKYKKVYFLIDGEEIDSVMGHLDCSGYFTSESF